MKKLYFLLLTCCAGLLATAQNYTPHTQVSFTGANTYCLGATISPLIFTYDICSAGSGPASGATCELNWYYNPVNSNVVGPSTTLASGPYTVITSTTSATGTENYTPALPVGGDYYFFCIIKWTTPTPDCSGWTTDSVVSTTQLVKVMPAPITGGTGVCVGSAVTLNNYFTGGTWSSTNPGVLSINATTGVAQGISPGASFVNYTIGGCTVNAFISVNDTPSAIGPSAFTPCEGTTMALTSSPSGGVWSTSATAIADVGPATGILTAGVFGTANITYTNTTTGCRTSRTITVNANPAAITGATAICTGSTTSLSNVSSPGTWLSSSPGVASINNTSGLVTSGSSGGTTTITYKLTTTGCQATRILTVNMPPLAITGPDVVCAGSNITLANARPGGVWTSGNMSLATVVSGTGVVTGVSNGSVNITYTMPGCASTFKNITVNPLPGTIGGLLSVCYGQVVTLSSTVGGGTWSSSDTSVATIDTMLGIVSGHSLGTTVIYYTVPSGCQATANVTVNPLAPILGSDTVCVGSDILLTNIVGGGTWVSSNPDIAEADTFSGVIHGLVPGITYIGYSLPTGCATTFFLNVIPALPPIAGPLKVCSAADVILSNGITGGRWTTSNEFVADIDSASGTMTGHFPDTATITYTIYGCVATATITVDPLPSPSLNYTWASAQLATTPTYISYQWFDSTTGVIPGATNFAITLPNVQKTYRVRVTDMNGCGNYSEWFRTPLGVSSADLSAQVRVFPNPVQTTVTIDAPINITAVISSTDGKVLTTVHDAKQVDMSNLAPGFYLLALYSDEGQLISMQKLSKE